MEVLSEHNCQGWLEGYLLSGRHGLFATYEAFAMVSASMAIQHTKWLEEMRRLGVARAGRLAQRPPHLDLLAQRPQRLQPSGAGLDRHDAQPARRGRPHLLPARRQQPAQRRRPLPAQPRLRQPDRPATSSRSCSTSAIEEAASPRGARRVALGVGEQRRRARAGRRPRLRRRHPDPGDAGRRLAAAPPHPGAGGAGRQRDRPDGRSSRAKPTRTGCPRSASSSSSAATTRS